MMEVPPARLMLGVAWRQPMKVPSRLTSMTKFHIESSHSPILSSG